MSWRKVLPRLRMAARVKRDDLVAQLADRLGVPDREDKVARYYNAMEHEQLGIAAYRKLLKQTEGKSVVLEEYARKMVHGEETHVMDIEKMLRRPGKLEPAR